ncbi:MAG TPA: hypothetical protein VHF01_12270 [Candidatus Acidoferrum sp.]|nr:hypothetical protein [Candidatus Acidoferrum sp.]
MKQISVSESGLARSLGSSERGFGGVLPGNDSPTEDATWGFTVAETAAVAPNLSASRRVNLFVITYLVAL